MEPPSTDDLRRWGARRVEEGRWAGTYRQPTVSLPRSSNWTCPFRTSSFPTGFTAAPTRAGHTTWCRATAPRITRFALRGPFRTHSLGPVHGAQPADLRPGSTGP